MRRSGRDCETTYGFPANNNSILEFCRAYPNKFLGFWGIDPHKGMDAVREVEHVIKDLGMRGIATDPYLAHCPPSDARYYPIYAKCVELGVPVFVTTAPPAQVPRAIMDYIDPRQIDVVARDFPELILIMSHGGYPFVNEAIFACMRNANVYMDLSEYELAPMAEVCRRLNKMIGDKVISSAHLFIEQADAIETKNLNIRGVAKRSCTRPPRRSSSTRAFPQYRKPAPRLQQRQVPAAVPALRPDGTLGFCGELRFRAVPWGGNAPRPAELFWVTRG
ncbi:MAG: amidohydrolase family protein [Bilophila wadsworthia]